MPYWRATSVGDAPGARLCAAIAQQMRDLALRHLHPFRGTGHPAVNAALRNHYFDSIGLPRLYVPVSA
jgi:hypothetical protein